MPTLFPFPKIPGSTDPKALGTAMEQLKHRWGWFIALGAVAFFLGIIALALQIHATIVTVYIVALCMILAGGTEITVGLNSHNWGKAFLWGVAGLFYVVAGAFFLARPVAGAELLTLLLGAALLAAGCVRIYIGTHMHSHARTMVIVAGAVTGLVGLLVIFGWPANSLVILGTLLGIDLIVTGLIWVAFGLRLRNHA